MLRLFDQQQKYWFTVANTSKKKDTDIKINRVTEKIASNYKQKADISIIIRL